MIYSYKDELRQIDHDCRRGDPDDGCHICAEIDEMTEQEAKEKFEELKKYELDHKEAK